MPIRRLIPDPIRRNVGPSGGVPGGGGGQFRGLLCGIGQVQKRAAFGIGWSSDTSLLEDASCKETGGGWPTFAVFPTAGGRLLI